MVGLFALSPKITREANLSVNSQLINPLFEDFFKQIYGARWERIRAALGQKPKQVLRQNNFASSYERSGLEKFPGLIGCYRKPDEFSLKKDDSGLFMDYVMDPASVIVAAALDVKPEDDVLDMCAAPGGKTLVLAEQMNLEGNTSGTLIANEFSKERRERLSRVLQEYVPRDKRLFITVKGLDANQYGLRWANSYDRVLADVPCSGERHLLENPSEYSLWTEKRTKNLAVRQYSILSSAWLSVRSGGRIVYSTCSISPLENDDVVAKLVKKRKVEIIRPDWLADLGFLEHTQYGYAILPDTDGFGPMYFSVIQKN